MGDSLDSFDWDLNKYREDIDVPAFVDGGIAFRLVPHYVDIEKPRDEIQDKYILLVLNKRVDDLRVEEEKEEYPEEVKIWEPVYVHDINDYEVLDKEEYNGSGVVSTTERKLIKLKAGAVTIKIIKFGFRGFNIVEAEFDTDDRGLPITEKMKERKEKMREEKRQKDRESFRKQYGVTSYRQFPGMGS